MVEDLFFTVKINEAAKRAGLPIAFVKSEHDALDQRRESGADHPGSELQRLDPVDLIRKLRPTATRRSS